MPAARPLLVAEGAQAVKNWSSAARRITGTAPLRGINGWRGVPLRTACARRGGSADIPSVPSRVAKAPGPVSRSRYELHCFLKLQTSGAKPELDKAWMIPPSVFPAAARPRGKDFSSSGSREEDEEAGGLQEGGCSPPPG